MKDQRLKTILGASIVAIVVNIGLASFKAVVGYLTHSVAITMDAVNNFTDAASGFITMIAAFYAGKDADRKHPFGHGRMEYLGTLLICGLILYAGITALIESVTKIIHPEAANYTTTALVIIAVAVVVKIGLALFSLAMGKKVNSDSLVAAGKDAMGDVVISLGTLVAAFVFIFAHVSIEAWLGAIIACMIIKAGAELLKETVDKLLGMPGEVELVKDIKKAIASHEQVKGAYDLIIHNYGPDSNMASVHIAVEDTVSIDEFDQITRELQTEIAEKFGIYLSAVSVYCVNTRDEETIQMREKINRIMLEDEHIHQMHGFYYNKAKKEMRFDLVISFDSEDRTETYNKAMDKLKKEFPDFQFVVGMDVDFNEI